MTDKHYALAREEIIAALTAYTGMTTADGATPGNNTLIDSLLIGKNDFITGKTILIGAGYDASYEDEGASAFDPLTGTITFTAGFSAQIKAGTIYRVLNLSSNAQVSSLLNDIKAKTDALPAAPANEATSLAIQPALGRKFSMVDSWSAPTDKITVTAVAADLAFPDIVVAALPTGLSVQKVVLILAVRAINDTSAADNYIDAANKTLRIKPAAGAWGTDDIVAITFANQSLYCKANQKEPGPVIIGSADLSSVVNANGTYNIMSNQTNRGDAISALADNLELYDIQVGLRVFYS
jgi:hypothetical protein